MFDERMSYGELTVAALMARPDADAIVHAGGRLSYKALHDLVSRYEQALTRIGIGKGAAVAFLAPNHPEYFAAMIACALLGARYTPLHPLGSFEDHHFVLEDAAIEYLIFDTTKFVDRGLGLKRVAGDLKAVVAWGKCPGVDDLRDIAAAFEPREISTDVDVTATLAVAYTGGTTGKPKGAILSHRCITEGVRLVCEHWQWPDEIRLLLCTPISHAAGAMVVPTFLQGGTVYLSDGFTPSGVLSDVETHRITATFLIPTMIYLVLDELERCSHDMSSLQTIFYGAAPMSPTRLKEAIGKFGRIFQQLYGQVEGSVALAMLSKEDHADDGLCLSCGKPLTPANFAILDEEMAPVAVGEIGEICVTGPTIMDGYRNRDSETQAAFRGGWLHTGDLARQDEAGFVYIVDRAKDMIVTGGFNVFPREIEDTLTAHSGVHLAAVIGVPHPKWGEAVHALIVRSDKGDVSPDELVELVRQKKGVTCAPKTLEFVDSLPLTALGKIDKKVVRQKFWVGQERMVS